MPCLRLAGASSSMFRARLASTSLGNVLIPLVPRNLRAISIQGWCYLGLANRGTYRLSGCYVLPQPLVSWSIPSWVGQNGLLKGDSTRAYIGVGVQTDPRSWYFGSRPIRHSQPAPARAWTKAKSAIDPMISSIRIRGCQARASAAQTPPESRVGQPNSRRPVDLQEGFQLPI